MDGIMEGSDFFLIVHMFQFYIGFYMLISF